jgi:PPOX class probable FMN-dependent enzyme
MDIFCMTHIKTVEQLRQIYKYPKGRPVEKVISRFEEHSRAFIALSPFLIIGSSRKDGIGDVSPRGEAPGFVKVLDDTTCAIPDRPGNNRLDTMNNILQHPQIGLIFLIPGVNETLRINGVAEIRDDDDLRQMFVVNERLPATVMVVKVNEIYLHCAKALMRSRLWQGATKIDRCQLPTMGKMINDQINSDTPLENQEDMAARYEKTLY